jgi:hypothetical protein
MNTNTMDILIFSLSKINYNNILSHYFIQAPEYVDPLSDNMRQRLMREASTGLDSEAKQSNVILYIGVAVAVLVALGGQGILY